MKRLLSVAVSLGLTLVGSGAITANAQTKDNPRLMVQAISGKEINGCAYSRDGSVVITSGRDGMARLWDVDTGSELQFYKAAGWIKSVALSADHRKVLTVSGNDGQNAVQLWDEVTGKELQRFSSVSGSFAFVAFSPDESRVNTVSAPATDEQGHALPFGSAVKVQAWSVESGKEVEHFVLQSPGISSALTVLSPDGSKLFTGNFNGPLLWDVKTGKVLQHFQNHSEVLMAGAFSADGRSVLTGSIPGTVRLLDTETGKEIQHFAETPLGRSIGSVNSVAFSADGRRVLAGSNDRMVRLWDVATGKEVQLFRGDSGGINCVAFSPDGREVLTGSGQAQLWNVETGNEIRRFIGLGDTVGSLAHTAFVENGHGILTVSTTGMAWLWDTETGKATTRLATRANEPSVVISPDGRRIFIAPIQGEPGVWDTETGKEVQRFDQKTFGVVTAVAFSSSGHGLLATTDGAKLRVWDLDAGKELQQFLAKPGWHPRFLYPAGDMRAAVETLALSHDGQRIVTADSEGGIRLWDVKTGTKLRSFKLNAVRTITLGFSPDGRSMLTKNVDDSSLLRDVKTGKEIQHFGAASTPSFSADGRRVMLGTSVWDVETGKDIQRFVTSSGNAIEGRLSRDGHLALIGTDNGATILWDVDVGKELASLYCFDDGSWAVVDSEGRFDTDKLSSNIALRWIIDNNPVRIVPLSTYQQGYYTPRLLARILKGEKLSPVP